jgi:HAD superfamily hydrolase (TIGR01549 family)
MAAHGDISAGQRAGEGSQAAGGEAREIRALLFDLDRTLLGQDKVVTSWLVGLAQRYIVGPLAQRDERIGSAALTLPPRSVVRLARRADAALSRTASLDAAAKRLLVALRRAGLPFGIVSNARRYRRETIRALGLEEATSCIFLSQEVGRRKPEQEIFQAAAACLGIPAHQILFVGDKPRSDVQGAQGAGMRTAWVRRGRRWPRHAAGAEPDLTVDSLDALVDILAL